MVIDNPEKYRGVFDIGGPEHISYRDLVGMMAEASGHGRPVLNVPMGIVRFGAGVLGKIMASPPVTMDQLRLLEADNITDADAVRKAFGFEPAGLKEALKEFMR